MTNENNKHRCKASVASSHFRYDTKKNLEKKPAKHNREVEKKYWKNCLKKLSLPKFSNAGLDLTQLKTF